MGDLYVCFSHTWQGSRNNSNRLEFVECLTLVYFDHKFGKHVCFNVFLGSTDQCAAMEAAISNVLNNTRHRWCRWHVLRTAKEKIGPVHSKYSGFRKEFHTLINDVLCPNDFERGWRKLVAKYNLGNNTYLHRIYTKRVMWAKPYFTGDFCCGMTSTQHSESANRMLKTYIPRSAPMHVGNVGFHGCRRIKRRTCHETGLKTNQISYVCYIAEQH